jgi:hypothetical protein
MVREYDMQEIQMLCKTIRGEEGASEWLTNNGFKELSEFWSAYEDVEVSFQWLKENGYLHFAALVDAMSGNETAKAWLIKNKFVALGILVDAAAGNKSAVEWLLKAGEKGWVLVAKEIFEYEQKKNKKGKFWNIFNLGNPYG